MEPANLQAFVTRASDSELYVHRSCICICIIDEHVAKLYVTATRVRIVKKKGLFKKTAGFLFLFFSFFENLYLFQSERFWVWQFVCRCVGQKRVLLFSRFLYGILSSNGVLKREYLMSLWIVDAIEFAFSSDVLYKFRAALLLSGIKCANSQF